MKYYYIETYGCQMNVADSELVAGIMEKNGYGKIDAVGNADAVFINTCAIREHAEDKIHSRLGVLRKEKERRPDMILGLMGCMAQHVKDDILENKPYVDFVLGPDSYRRIPGILRRHEEKNESIVDTKLSRFEVYSGMYPSRNEGINAWISIMRGCDKFCTFCIVPFTRGRERSRPVSDIVQEVRRAVDDGFAEVTLLGQNVNSFRRRGKRFPELLQAVAEIPGLQRVRFTSPHPQDVNDDMLFVMRDNANLCKSIHLPVQAGSDRILKRMNRTYSQAEFLALVSRIRQLLPGCGLTTDIIVGFPGETRDDFEETLKVMEKIKFDSAFTFKYSPRPGTKATEYSDHVSESEKQARLEALITVQKRHTLFLNKREIGEVVKVLVEKESKKSSEMWAGRTDTNKWVLFAKETTQMKQMVNVRITDAHGVTLFGELVGDPRRFHAVA
ncbi:MAG: tRNA (N6-isopentenyl adenosine(37)-C2)-methylthiotransferase MiaB [Candidatus Marinimicrobia bacterium]|nr:tRNA (N6-isopentenyl adenosine(37)-C2)-methylthiotransferase MiaB [Candidatus Neomarinimicrobiota bacterium]